jgi:Neuraminidase (sialidase)
MERSPKKKNLKRRKIIMKQSKILGAMLLGTLLIVLIIGTVGSVNATNAFTVAPLTLVSGPSPYATCTVGAGTGTNYVNAEVEPFVAVNPTNPSNIIGAWQQDRWSNGGAHGLVAGYSNNGGKTWKEVPLPFSSCAPGGLPYERASDPWVSIGPDGTAYANAISFNRTNNANAVASSVSTDGGKTWTNLTVIQSFGSNGGQFSTDKNSITADPVKAGVAYQVWDTLITPTDNPDDNPHTASYTGPGYFSKTTDGGKTWSAPQIIFPTDTRNQTIANQIVVDSRNGTIYDFANWIIQPNTFHKEHDQIAFVKSTDGGATWTAPQAIMDMNVIAVTDPNTGALIRTGDIIPSPAINPATGQLYVTFQTAMFSNGAFDEVAVITSTDGGATWSAPVRVNTPTGRPAFTPSIRVNANGVVAVSYYDFRNLQAGNTTTLPTDYWIVSSSDGGKTFGNEQHIAGPFDMLTAPYARGYFVGDYEGLASFGSTFVPFFVQANSGNTSNRTDAFSTSVTP